ncbi:hypothetical protein LTS18_009593 [Coniosporium uncinatum]|uniref:Uncharacterized protein n=1 Tax=Coniosporium uncinatum TaxID=93489 RepID=A0ACC3DMD5_9PEZI|nr:hypothetical protein LTS18_009593 [Coniosporium uncinatum]
MAAGEFGLDVLAEDINDEEGNETRFLVLRNVRDEGNASVSSTSSSAQEQQQQQQQISPSNPPPKPKPRSHIVSVRPLGPPSSTETASSTSPATHLSGSQTNAPAPQPSPPPKQRKTLLLLHLPHPTHSSPGALASALAVFKPYGLNLTSINTRPSGGEAWTYVFFIEVLEVGAGGAMERALESLRGVVGDEGVRVLGGWGMQG